MIEQWILDNWEGVMIRIENEAFTGLSYSVPGWKCKHCGHKIGSRGAPPRVCWNCGYDSSKQTITTEVEG